MHRKMYVRAIRLLGIAVICLAVKIDVLPQDKNLIITVRKDIAEFQPGKMPFESYGKDTLFLKRLDTRPYVLHIRNENGPVDAIDFSLPSVTKSDTMKFKLIHGYAEEDMLLLDFADSLNIGFISGTGKDTVQQLIIQKRSALKEADYPDGEVSFIPPSLRSGKGGWPGYRSEYGNPKYRVALDLSQSFSSISLWELSAGMGKYNQKNRLRPGYGEFMSVSIKGLSPQFDSLSSSYKFSNLHQEGKDQFNLVSKSLAGFPETGTGAGSKETEPSIKDAAGQDSATREQDAGHELLTRLRSDLLEYEMHLNNNIIEQSVWHNEVRYIQNRLRTYFKLEDYSPSGLRKALEMRSKDTLLIDQILVSYARILVYSIYTTPPVQIEDADILSYKFAFYKDGKEVEKRSYNFLVKGGWKIDFSAGFAYSFLMSEKYLIKNAGTRYDTVYYVDEYFNTTDSITAVNEVKQKEIIHDSNVPNVGACVFAHFYPRFGSMINLSGTLGFMINANAEYSYLAGLSLIMGKKQRCILSAGANIGMVDRLIPKYEMDTPYTETELGGISESQLTGKKWDSGFFLGVSYNF